MSSTRFATQSSAGPIITSRYAPLASVDGSERATLQPWERTVPIIAVCHLSWNWVWQRPQQFLSRLAKTHPLLFVETHCSDVPETTPQLRTEWDNPAIRILELHLPAARWNDAEYIDLERRRALQEVMAGELAGLFDESILWINDPMAVTSYAGHLGERMIVYDCMDELTQFHGAPATLVERERELTEVADVIFCGGQKMREKRLAINSNCHFYGTGVDCDHFGACLDSSLSASREVSALPGPVLGYFGVIDERIDYELLEKLADSNPDWSVVMVGPFAKIDPAVVPRRVNLHWFGPRAYSELPAITKGFDVCLMPFALNAATEYINPTKALEYMAAGKPVVSTALAEVKSNFSCSAEIASNHEEFIELCLVRAASPAIDRMRQGLELAEANTWEAIVEKMEGHIADVLASAVVEYPRNADLRSLPSVTGNIAAYV